MSVATGVIDLHWEQAGQGPPILCLPGFASSNWIFRDLAARLKQRFTLIMPDHRGMGKSPHAPGAYPLSALADDALALMDRLGHREFALIGVSMGGFVAQLLALAAPHRLGRMALLCSSSSGPGFADIFPVLPREQVRAIYALPPRPRVMAALGEALLPCLKKDYPQIYAAVVETRIQEYEAMEQVLLQYDAVAAFLRTPLDLGAIGAPVLVMTGDRDLVTPPQNARRLADRLPNARLSVVKGTDHLFFLERPETVAEQITRFFL